MKYNTQSNVEEFFKKSDVFFEKDPILRKIQTITVENYVVLGQLTALRFLEWVCLNPKGVVALPTGKTPEFFIKWMQYYLQNWDKESNGGMLEKVGLKGMRPDFSLLHFFQLDEFFPISPNHERSFTYFVKKFYLDAFGFDPKKTRLINTHYLNNDQQKILGHIKSLDDLFCDGIDFSLRITKPSAEIDKQRQAAIRLFDEFCASYEAEIRSLGGIGFFLGGIGPDGHIAFNISGSSHYSHTRLTGINYETQATAATDLGGIELVRKKAVITIGLETITYNPDNVAIIMAAGQSKSKVVANAIQKESALVYPATALQSLPNARFFITQSSTTELELDTNHIKKLYADNILNQKYPEKLTVEASLELGKDLQEIALQKPEHPKLLLAEQLSNIPAQTLVRNLYHSIDQKIIKGLKIPIHQKFLHTAPHHDDIELAYFPLLHHLVRSEYNQNHFVYCTSGFTSVTNDYLKTCLIALDRDISNGTFRNLIDKEKNFSLLNAQDDITGYLQGIAYQNKGMQELYLSSRIARNIAIHLSTKSLEVVHNFVRDNIATLNQLEAGRKEPSIMHVFKGWLREFEAELVWAHFGLGMEYVHHLRLPFYTDDIFPQYPNFDNDVVPILNLMEKIKPTIITLALDPEGSGPDTHFKTLIALSEAIEKYHTANPDIDIEIWGYRNVWSRYKIHEANMMVPVSLNSFAVLHNMFNSCFLSQKSASFPSYEYDGTFSGLAQEIWVNQHNDIINLMGKKYLYSDSNPMKKRSYGFVYMKAMNYTEFMDYMKPVRKLLTLKGDL